MAYSVLVVDAHPFVLSRLVEPLRNAGYRVTGATTFEAATVRLAVEPPNLLIAAARLGLFNGLHLVVRGRYDHPQMAAIVTTGVKDPVLEAEASSLGAACLVSPTSASELLAFVARTLAEQPM